jgi:hypothetical protein
MKNDYDLTIKKLEMHEFPEDISKNFSFFLYNNCFKLR